MPLLLSLLLATPVPTAPPTNTAPAKNEWEKGPAEILPAKDEDTQISLYPDTRKELDGGIQQIGFTVTFPGPSGNKGSFAKVSGTLQVKCDTKEYRHIQSRITDEKGITSTFPNARTEGDWDKFGDDYDDKQLHGRMCGTNSTAK